MRTKISAIISFFFTLWEFSIEYSLMLIFNQKYGVSIVLADSLLAANVAALHMWQHIFDIFQTFVDFSVPNLALVSADCSIFRCYWDTSWNKHNLPRMATEQCQNMKLSIPKLNTKSKFQIEWNTIKNTLDGITHCLPNLDTIGLCMSMVCMLQTYR